MKIVRKEQFQGMSPPDDVLLACWKSGLDTKAISKKLMYPEYCVDSRLWRLRKEERERT